MLSQLRTNKRKRNRLILRRREMNRLILNQIKIKKASSKVKIRVMINILELEITRLIWRERRKFNKILRSTQRHMLEIGKNHT